MTKRAAIFIEKTKHVDTLVSLLESRPELKKESDIFALRADTEMCLEEKGILYNSARTLRNPDYEARMMFAEKKVTEMIELSELDFWNHRYISLGSLNRISAQDYFLQLLYWLEIVLDALRGGSYNKIIVFDEADIDESSKALSNKKLHTFRTIASLCSHKFAYETEIVEIKNTQQIYSQGFVENIKQQSSIFLISALNSFVATFRRPKKMKLFISDIWRNIKPYLEELTEAEVVLWERSEIKHIGLKNIFKYRMRFMHADAFRTQKHIQIATQTHETMLSAWTERKGAINYSAVWNGIDLTEHVFDVYDDLIKRSYRDVLLIEDTFRMFKKLNIQTVLVRASTSTQLHFPVLCLAAKQLNITSIEAQHGLFYLGPSSVPKFSTSSVMATYGKLANEELKFAGYSGNCTAVGSPRFDVYTKIKDTRIKNNTSTPRLLIVLPDDTTGLWFDTYDILDLVNLFTDISKNTSVVFKARPGAPAAKFGIESVSKVMGGNVHLAIHEQLHELFQETDIVVSVYSTILIEALMAGLPLLYLASAPFHSQVVELHMSHYDGVVPVIKNKSDIEAIISKLSDEKAFREQVDVIERFLGATYTISAGSAKRFADLVMKL